MPYAFNPFTGTLDFFVAPTAAGALNVPLDVATGVVYAVPANSQVLFSEPIKIHAGGQIHVAAGSVLKEVT